MADKKRSRNAYRRHLKNNEGEIKNVIEEFDISKKNKLIALKISLEDKLKKVNELDEDILAEITDDELYDKEFDEVISVKEHCCELMVRIDECLSDATLGHGRNMPPGSVTDDSVSSSSAELKVSLPKIKLEAFDGNPLNWISFWDQFKSAVHERERNFQM